MKKLLTLALASLGLLTAAAMAEETAPAVTVPIPVHPTRPTENAAAPAAVTETAPAKAEKSGAKKHRKSSKKKHHRKDKAQEKAPAAPAN